MRLHKIFLLTIAITYCHAARGATVNVPINEIRILYGKSVADAKTAQQLFSILSNVDASDPLALAYRGASEALMAKHSWNPYRKLSYLDQSMETLEEAIRRDPGNPEIRFLRFSIQYYVPAFLGYSKNLDEDKSVIVNNFSSLHNSYDSVIVKGVGDFLISSGRCTSVEVDQIRAAIQ